MNLFFQSSIIWTRPSIIPSTLLTNVKNVHLITDFKPKSMQMEQLQ